MDGVVWALTKDLQQGKQVAIHSAFALQTGVGSLDGKPRGASTLILFILDVAYNLQSKWWRSRE